jgi:single-stranded-DNA-specific exonuclease
VTTEPPVEWRLRLPASVDAVRDLTEELRVHPLLAATVWSRGLREAPAARLQPELTPAPIPTLDAAAERVATAVTRRERILLHGDYDADGLTATAILTLGLRAVGANVTPFVPDRLADGYGIHPDRVDEHAEHADLLLTVDCGITNLQEVARLRGLGVDVIVSDHHVPDETLPDALVVHPHLAAADDLGTRDLTGAGVAYHLLWALHRRLGLEEPLAYADLAAIGTIADVAPLLGANRALVREGLARLSDSARPGLRELVRLAKLRDHISAHHVAFVLAPRLNAAGRLGRASDALELLVTGSTDRARVLATLMDVLNQERRTTQDAMLQQALALVDLEAPAAVLRHDDWHPGVMGIVASKVLERHFRPVYVIAQGKGSVRSTPGISAVAGLRAASAYLTRYGGHEAAAGFALDEQHFERFRDAIYDFVAGHPRPVRTVTADVLLRPEQVTADLHAALAGLEPYGEGHPAPRFAVHGRLTHLRAVGRNGDHLQLGVGGAGSDARGVAWGLGHEAKRWTLGSDVTAVASLIESTFRERTQIELRAEAITSRDALRLLPTDPPPSRFDGAATDLASDRLRLGSPPPDGGAGRHLRRLEPRGLDPLADLREALASGETVYLDLDAAAIDELAAAADAYPTVHDVRLAFVHTSRGHPLPWPEAKATLVRRALEELELLDDRGRARRGQRRDPYDAPTLRASLVARYALDTVVNVVRALPGEDAARAILALVGSGGAGAVHAASRDAAPDAASDASAAPSPTAEASPTD